jgi:tRNA (guanine-N7-)-methyltransferase
MNTSEPALLRSFVRRSGRITRAQQKALETLSQRYVLATQPLPELAAVFGRDAPRHLEIGFGMGGALLEMARAHPEIDYLGIDVHLPGIGQVLARIEAESLPNIRVWQADAVEILQGLPPDCLDTLYIFFPDPWHKKRHHKRRLIRPEVARLLVKVLKPGGKLYLATDWEDYAMQMLEVLNQQPGLANPSGGFIERPPQRPLTKFEQRGLRLGHGIWDLHYVKG